jgi:hypothetical protein
VLTIERISSTRPRTGWSLCACVGRMPRRVRSRPTPHATTHAPLPFFVFAQAFGASVSHFLVSLSYLTTMNSIIFGIVNSVILAIVNSVILATELSHFIIFVSHSATVTSPIPLENSFIPRSYSTQSFLLQQSATFATLVSHFVFCYSELSHFYDTVSHFSLL